MSRQRVYMPMIAAITTACGAVGHLDLVAVIGLSWLTDSLLGWVLEAERNRLV